MKKISLLGILLFFCFSVYAKYVTALPDFVTLVEQYGKSVVNIKTVVDYENNEMPEIDIPNMPEEIPFDELFRHFFEENPNYNPPENQSSLGSGFIISQDGYIVTNYHVVSSAKEVIVSLSDRREFVAKIIGSDKRSDIALLKIAAENLPVVKIGNSNALSVGEWVLAIGSPFGFERTATQGIVSAINRSLPDENYIPFIQTDVAINPGNSGGPLFNLNGEVIGVNSQIYSRTGGFMGLSFAVPINVAMNVVEQLKTNGKVIRGWLGVLIQEVDYELSQALGLDKPKGAVIVQVLPDSPAQKAGLKVNDVILSFNAQPIRNSTDLPPLVGQIKPNQQASLSVLRKNKSITLAVTIEALPDDLTFSDEQQPVEEVAGEFLLGLKVRNLTREERNALGINHSQGILVQEVKSKEAVKAGFKSGDVILQFAFESVDNVEHFYRLVEQVSPGDTVAVLVQREKNPLLLALKIPK